MMWVRAAFAGAWVVVQGCDPAATLPPVVPEPAEALRPPDLRGDVPAAAKVVDYEIHAHLDTETHQVRGTVKILWHNRSRQRIASIPLHLYMNGFRAEDTAWMLESRGQHRSTRQGDDGQWGYIDLKAVRQSSRGRDIDLQQHEHSAPGQDLAWHESDDPSLATVTLPSPVEPGEAVVIELEFVTQLPEVFARTGYADTFHMVAQWFPKPGVLQPDGTWQAHVFTLNAEFFADFGDYDVHLDVPTGTVVGATGILVTSGPGEPGRQLLHYHAEMVHDFAWTADPKFLVHDSEWRGIRIRQLMRPEHIADAERHREALTVTLESMQHRFGAYPWSTITIVHPPEAAKGAQGMEYPTLFTTTPVWHPPAWLALFGLQEHMSGSFTTIHEFGHQYFQGLLASDEAAQPWLDEGLNTTANMLTLADWRGPNPWLVKLGNQTFYLDSLLRGSLDAASTLDPIDAPAETYRALLGTYGDVVYRKTAAMLLTLRRLAGADRFDAAFKRYATTWRFRHPTGNDLTDTFLRDLGPTIDLGPGPTGDRVHLDLADYFDQALHQVAGVEFRLEIVQNRRRAGQAGWYRDDHGTLVQRPLPDDAKQPVTSLADEVVEGVVVVRRTGEFRLPVELAIEFADGTRERVWWAGQTRYHIFTWPGRRIRSAELDPDKILLLEHRRYDNVHYAEEFRPADGVSEPVRALTEAAALATLGGLSL